MKIADVTLERLLLDELPAAQAGQVRYALAVDGALRDRLQSLTRSSDDESIRIVAAGVRARLSAQPAAWRLPLWWPAPVAVGVLMAALAVQIDRAPAGGTERVKGPDATLAIYRQTPSGSEQLDDRALAHEGDLIRIAYRVNGDAFGAIVSVDGRGAVTVHYPDGAATAAPMSAGQSVLLAHAYELDDAPKWERFYIITGTTPFAIDAVVDAATRAGQGAPPALALAPDMTQSSFLLQKDSRP